MGSKCGVIRSNIDSTNPVILSDHPADTNPEVSPDGSQVVFMSKRSGDWEVYLVGIDGGNITALTSDDASNGLPTWSPEGDKIAYVSNRDGEWSVWDMDPDGVCLPRGAQLTALCSTIRLIVVAGPKKILFGSRK